MLDIRLPANNSAQTTALKTAITQLSGVKGISQNAGAPTSKSTNLGTVFNLREKFDQSKMEVNVKISDAHYLETYGIQLLAGRFIEARDEQQCLETVPRTASIRLCAQ